MMDGYKSYYEEDSGNIQVYCGDCLEIMSQIKDNSVDMILTDPPYGIDFCSSRTNRKEKLQNDKLNDWQAMLKPMLLEFKRILTNTGCCCCCGGGGGKTPATAIFTMEAIKHFNLIQTLVWKKFIGLGWRYRPSYENIVVLSKDKNNYNFYDTSKKCSNVIEGINQDIPQYRGNEVGNHDEHPTQKPITLMKRLLSIHSKKGDTILDPFMGSGTTLVAAKELNRKAIGIEIVEKYCEIAKKRLQNTIKPFL
jgi:site-specific DNA-methyltransferase (adenine-specific)